MDMGDYMSFFNILILGVILVIFPVICVLTIKAYMEGTCNINK